MRLLGVYVLWTASFGAGSIVRPAPSPRFVAIVNPSNPTPALTAAQLRDVLLGNRREWPNHRRITIVQRDANEPEVSSLLKSMLGMSVGEYNRYLMNLEFRGKEPPALKTLLTNESACNFVFNAPGAIGFLPASVLNSLPCGLQVKVLKVPDSPDFLWRSQVP